MLVVPPSKAPLVSVASVGCATTASFGVWLHKRSPDAARNATGATFAWGPFRPLDFSGPRTPPECEAPPEDHSQLVGAYRLLMGRRYSSRISRVPAPCPRCAARAALVATRCGSTTANGAYLGLPRAKSTAAVLKLGSLSVLGHRESRRAPAAINNDSVSG